MAVELNMQYCGTYIETFFFKINLLIIQSLNNYFLLLIKLDFLIFMNFFTDFYKFFKCVFSIKKKITQPEMLKKFVFIYIVKNYFQL